MREASATRRGFWAAFVVLGAATVWLAVFLLRTERLEAAGEARPSQRPFLSDPLVAPALEHREEPRREVGGVGAASRPSAGAIAESTSCDCFPTRSIQHALPFHVSDAEQLKTCPIFNPARKELDPSQIARLLELVRETNEGIEKHKQDVFRAQSDWTTEKVMRLGAGAPLGSPEAEALRSQAKLARDFVGVVSSPQLDEDIVFTIAPGEYAPLDVAYDDLWLYLRQRQGLIAAFFDSL